MRCLILNETHINLDYRNTLYGMKLNHLEYEEKTSPSCINSFSVVQVLFFDNNLDLIDSDMHTQFTQCESIYGHSIIEKNSLYYVISDAICENYKISYEPLDGDLSPIEITDGSFFLNIKKIRKIFFKAGTFPSSEISSVSC